ncbi:hypothetical protein [Engelhardtia mirabilis]|uniref:Uncharacterized protein n=1 Tax=Engelhardtia mirabilis TaxID=2528011 RepID=A0A518BFP8_9BACT|nr:hypothetical protein Pla133_08580 [Planctomycetes bacterium Pla133]QDV00118.1 hypothetical protein Pla86_08570 [Planctomycetes bacterium Pla86]
MSLSPTLRKLLLGLGLAALLLLVVPLGLAWAHFATTPTFDEWLASHPAADALWEEALVPGHEPLEGRELMGVVDPLDEAVRANHDIKVVSFKFVASRDGATMLDARVLLTAALDPDTNDLRGLRLDPTVNGVDRDMRSVIALTVTAPSDESWARARAEVDVVVDFFLLGGSGESQTLLLRSQDSIWSELPSIDSPGLGSLLGIFLHPFGGPPEEGIFHHARQSVGLSWRKHEGGGQGIASRPMGYSTTDDEYSWDVELEVDETFGGGSGTTATLTHHQTMTWMGETW